MKFTANVLTEKGEKIVTLNLRNVRSFDVYIDGLSDSAIPTNIVNLYFDDGFKAHATIKNVRGFYHDEF